MVYNEKFIAVVKVNGKVLREQKDVVTLPYGVEYTLLLKNLESRRASVNVNIDSQDVLEGYSLILNPNSETELKGFMDKGQVRNCFKFIQKTKQISEHRGDNVDDGFIRIEFAFEKVIPEVIEHHHHHHDVYYPRFLSGGITGQSVMGPNTADIHTYHFSTTDKFGTDGSSSVTSSCSNVVSDCLDDSPVQDEGITVKGSETYQGFTMVHMGETEQSKTIIIRLKGTMSSGTPVYTPITVKTKITCGTCGTKSKSNIKYCPNCGTFIQ